MAARTVSGFCVVAALSRYTSGWPWTWRPRIGKRARSARGSKRRATGERCRSCAHSVCSRAATSASMRSRVVCGSRRQRLVEEPVHDHAHRLHRREAPALRGRRAAPGRSASHGGAVRAAHVVGEDLELGDRLGPRVVRRAAGCGSPGTPRIRPPRRAIRIIPVYAERAASVSATLKSRLERVFLASWMCSVWWSKCCWSPPIATPKVSTSAPSPARNAPTSALNACCPPNEASDIWKRAPAPTLARAVRCPDHAGVPALHEAVADVGVGAGHDLGDADDPAVAASPPTWPSMISNELSSPATHEHAREERCLRPPGAGGSGARARPRPGTRTSTPPRQAAVLIASTNPWPAGTTVPSRSAGCGRCRSSTTTPALAGVGVHLDHAQRAAGEQAGHRQRLVEAPRRADVGRHLRGRVAVGQETRRVGVAPEVVRAVGEGEGGEPLPRLAADRQEPGILAGGPRELLDVLERDGGCGIDGRPASQRSPPSPAR